MTLQMKAKTEWTATGAAYWGGVLGAVAVIVHKVYIVLFSSHPATDPFVHVMTEMALVVPGSAMVFAAVAGIRNWLLRVE